MPESVVSIITPSFNRADIVHETAASIFNQTYPHWEWMITDDGSTDSSWEVLSEFAARDERVKIFKRDREPKGACACRNISIERSTGEYLIFLDTDDVMANFCLEQRVQAMHEAPGCDFVIFPMMLFKKQPHDTGMLWNIDKGDDEINRLLFGDPVCQGTGTLWKKQSFVDIGMWDENLALWQDVELHLRSFLNGVTYKKRMDLLPDVFLRISEVSLSRTGYHSIKKLKSRIKVFMDTTNKVRKLQKISTYKEGLYFMGADIIASAIKSNFFNEGKALIRFCVENNVLSTSQAELFRQYLFARKFKLYKLPYLNRKINDRIQSILPQAEEVTLGHVPYAGKNLFTQTVTV